MRSDSSWTDSVRQLGTVFVEITGLSGLLGLFTVILVLQGVVHPAFLYGSGTVGLTLAIALSRSSSTLAPVRWPQPKQRVDWITSGIAYTAALGLSVLLGDIVWSVTQHGFIGTTVSAIVPIWLLRHIRFLLTLTA